MNDIATKKKNGTRKTPSVGYDNKRKFSAVVSCASHVCVGTCASRSRDTHTSIYGGMRRSHLLAHASPPTLMAINYTQFKNY